MRVDVLLFGPLSRSASVDRITVETQGDPTTAGEVLQALTATPSLASGLSACRLAVNHAFAADDTPIRATDEVALIGMVSGG
jgi:molybdopterin converting factor small subunit